MLEEDDTLATEAASEEDQDGTGLEALAELSGTQRLADLYAHKSNVRFKFPKFHLFRNFNNRQHGRCARMIANLVRGLKDPSFNPTIANPGLVSRPFDRLDSNLTRRQLSHTSERTAHASVLRDVPMYLPGGY